MRIPGIFAIAAGVAATASLGLSDPASARQLTFKECQALNIAAYSGGRVGRGQQGKVNAVVRECMRLYRSQMSTQQEIRARRSSSSAELLGDVLDVMGNSGRSHGKHGKKGKKHH